MLFHLLGAPIRFEILCSVENHRKSMGKSNGKYLLLPTRREIEEGEGRQYEDYCIFIHGGPDFFGNPDFFKEFINLLILIGER